MIRIRDAYNLLSSSVTQTKYYYYYYWLMIILIKVFLLWCHEPKFLSILIEWIRVKTKKKFIPMALDKLSPPLTRPSPVTLPPAASIRCFSSSSSGLWSMDKSTALPAWHNTQRESPALATTSSRSLSKATTAVHPLSIPGWRN